MAAPIELNHRGIHNPFQARTDNQPSIASEYRVLRRTFSKYQSKFLVFNKYGWKPNDVSAIVPPLPTLKKLRRKYLKGEI